MKPLAAPFEILSVRDTRLFVEENDRFIPVAGSGDARKCDRCDRTHEIHADVIDANGVPATVGTGCMNATTAAARKAAAAATRAAAAAAKAAAAEAARATLADIDANLPDFPADRVGFDPAGGFSDGCAWTVDGVKVYGFAGTPANDRERLDCLRHAWIARTRTAAAGGPAAMTRLARLARA